MSRFSSKTPVNAGVWFLNFACATTSKICHCRSKFKHVINQTRYANALIKGGGFGGCFGFLGSLPRLSRLPMAISSKVKLDPHRVRFSYAANDFARTKSIAVNGIGNFVCAVWILNTIHAAIFSTAALPKRKLEATILPNARSS